MPAAEQIAFSDETEWAVLQVLNEENAGELRQDSHNLLFCVSKWLMTVSVLKRFEERRLVLSEPTPQDRDQHRAALTQLRATGEKILMEFGQHRELSLAPIGLDRANLASAVNELRLKYAEWFSDMTEGRKGEILGEVFGVPA